MKTINSVQSGVVKSSNGGSVVVCEALVGGIINGLFKTKASSKHEIADYCEAPEHFEGDRLSKGPRRSAGDIKVKVLPIDENTLSYSSAKTPSTAGTQSCITPDATEGDVKGKTKTKKTKLTKKEKKEKKSKKGKKLDISAPIPQEQTPTEQHSGHQEQTIAEIHEEPAAVHEQMVAVHEEITAAPVPEQLTAPQESTSTHEQSAVHNEESGVCEVPVNFTEAVAVVEQVLSQSPLGSRKGTPPGSPAMQRPMGEDVEPAFTERKISASEREISASERKISAGEGPSTMGFIEGGPVEAHESTNNLTETATAIATEETPVTKTKKKWFGGKSSKTTKSALNEETKVKAKSKSKTKAPKKGKKGSKVLETAGPRETDARPRETDASPRYRETDASPGATELSTAEPTVTEIAKETASKKKRFFRSKSSKKITVEKSTGETVSEGKQTVSEGVVCEVTETEGMKAKPKKEAKIKSKGKSKNEDKPKTSLFRRIMKQKQKKAAADLPTPQP